MRIAVVKPDDLGDVILAVPAVHALVDAGHDVTLFCKPRIVALAQRLFRRIEARPIVFRHLLRPGLDTLVDESSDLAILAGFDAVVFMKRDAFIVPQRFSGVAPHVVFPAEAAADTPERHQAWENLDTVRSLLDASPSSLDRCYRDELPAAFPGNVGRVGLAIGTGFHTKRWPAIAWLELMRTLRDRAIEWTILCGIDERQAAERLVAAAGVRREGRIVLGGDDVESFLGLVRSCDVVIGVDGGTTHLCALAVPVVGLFGPSPFRRYAPVGRASRVVTLELGCSPCAGADPAVLNGCMSLECMFALLPSAVVAALDHPSREPGSSVLVDRRFRARAHFGLSHA
ncbi:MAG: glycosyltransferase family 9 protein [Alphaproteobacteria bacterium]|nr:glycosyltransferase family 9 protein [Alphaproteobacteria bacterium]